MIKDDIRFLTIRESLDFSRDILAAVVDHIVGSQSPSFLQLLVISRCGDHPCTEDLGDLNCGTPDSASAPQTSIVSPAVRCARVVSMCQAVRNTSGTEA